MYLAKECLSTGRCNLFCYFPIAETQFLVIDLNCCVLTADFKWKRKDMNA